MNQSDKLKEAAEALKFAKEMIKKHFIIPGEELTDALEYIDSTLDALSKDTEQDREWVSVETALPESNVPVLVYVSSLNSIKTDKFRTHDSYGGEKNWFTYEKVTHWRVLPTPPKPF